METRITNEQIQADNNLVNALEAAIKGWEMELAWVEKELIEQSLIDARAGERSYRYLNLEIREKALKGYLEEARGKLGKVAERYDIGPLKRLLTNALNAIRR
jgi:hypothetical protein